MRISQLLIISFFIFWVLGCGNTNTDKSDEGETERKSPKIQKISTKQNNTKLVESDTPDSVISNSNASDTEIIQARFVKFSQSIKGSIFVFEDKNGEEYWFHKARNAVGMDFVNNLQPMEEPEGYQNTWFKVTFENRKVERAGEVNTVATIVKVEKTQTSGSRDQDNATLGFSAEELKNAMFSGTEPFWSM